MHLRPRVVVAVAALALFTGVALAARLASPFATLGDTAVIELYTSMAARGQLLLGAYSRFQWHHPGPLYFFWMAPFYVLSGSRVAGLSAAAVSLNLVALAVVTAILARRASSSVAVATMTFLTIYSWRVAPIFTSAWNPNIPVLSFAALIVASAAVLGGRFSSLPLVAAFASLVAQTHVALLPSALALGAAATVGGMVVARRLDPSHLVPVRPLLLSGLVLLLLWSVPVVEQFTGRPGNIGELWRFFVSESHPGQRGSVAFAAWSDMMTGVLRPSFGFPRGQPFRPTAKAWIEAVAILQLAGSCVAGVVARADGRRVDGALAWLLAMLGLLTLWSTTRIEGRIFDHEVFWISGLGVLALAMLVAPAGDVAIARVPRLRAVLPSTAVVCWGLFVLCAVPAARWMRAAVEYSSTTSTESRVVSSVAGELRGYFDREHISRPLVIIDQEAWPLAAGVILQLHKVDVPVAVEDDWLPMFTPRFASTGRETVRLTLDAKPQHVRRLGKPGDRVLFEHDPMLFVHRVDAEPR